MSKELERKWWLKHIPAAYVFEKADQGGILAIEQSYLETKELGEIKILKTRNVDTSLTMYYMTVKSKSGLSRNECEEYIPPTLYNALLPFAKGRKIVKTRYRLKHTSEILKIDLFEGHLSKLVLLEIEFPNTELAEIFNISSLPNELKDLVLTEVTDDSRFKNSSLVFADSIPTLS